MNPEITDARRGKLLMPWNMDKMMKNSEQPMTGSYFKWKSGEVEMIFHFDIMNNPSIKGKKYSCGLFKELDAELVENVKAIYHTIVI